jgi:hypothetical protein
MARLPPWKQNGASTWEYRPSISIKTNGGLLRWKIGGIRTEGEGLAIILF